MLSASRETEARFASDADAALLRADLKRAGRDPYGISAELRAKKTQQDGNTAAGRSNDPDETVPDIPIVTGDML